MQVKFFTTITAIVIFATACKDNPGGTDAPPSPNPEGIIPGVVEPDVGIAASGEKISQLVGEIDREREETTQNETLSRYQLQATDLGVPFQDGETTWIIFGDTWGARGGNLDAMAYTTDDNPEDGLDLNFVAQKSNNVYLPIDIPGISQAAFEVPAEGLMVDDEMYIYHTTDHDPPNTTMGGSVLARRSGNSGASFEFVHNFSTDKFINISIVQVEAADWHFEGEGVPENSGNGLITFGSGDYRESEVYLAYQREDEIENPESVQYFAGIDERGVPLWDDNEVESLPVFELDTPCVGEFSVSYNTYIGRWIMLYNCDEPRGITLRTAENPWGPWTEGQILFDPWDDGGYCNYIHVNWEDQRCDDVHDENRENEWGGEYGPYQFEHFARGDEQSTTIYFTMSTWNPYTVVLMKAQLEKQNSPPS